ncbi:MAG TPA: DHA2 family efflux MFS transporter permease subunit [Polyangiaceae bacterium]|nr:DHA2 family efflux MFS transporter permease subunit [Polyangiaceae bacterium]
MSAPRKSFILATCCLSLFMVSMDVTIVNVALPAIRRDLGASVAGLEWAIDGYTVVVASFLMLAGSTGDRLGRRRTFQVGLALFSAGSLFCSLAPTTFVLVIARMVQALGGAMLNPVAMSIIANVFTAPAERARAIGIWGAVFGVSMAVGPVVGGFLTQAVGWRSIFWINIPVGLAAVALTARFVPESRAEKTRRPDLVGQLLVIVALASLTSGVIEGPRRGWDTPFILGCFALGLGAIAGLVAYEARHEEPLIDLRFFKSAPFAAATVTAVVAFASFSGFLFLNSLYLQDTRGLPASTAGLCTLPIALATVVCSPLSGRLVGAGHARFALVVAGAAMALAGLLLTDLRVETSMQRLILDYGVFGVGLGLVNAPITNTAVSGMPRAQAGLAAAVASTSRQVGAALGVAIAGSIAGGGQRTARSADFAQATRPVWWLVVGYGVTILLLGLASTGARARESARRVAYLLDEPEPGAAGR